MECIICSERLIRSAEERNDYEVDIRYNYIVRNISRGIHFLKTDKFKGICQLILVVISPIITLSFVSLKESRAFGGTDWEFLVHSATIDGSILLWLNLMLFVIEVVFIVRTIFKISKKIGA